MEAGRLPKSHDLYKENAIPKELTEEEIIATARALVADSIRAAEWNPRYAAELREGAQSLLDGLSPEQQHEVIKAGRKDARPPKPLPLRRIELKNVNLKEIEGEQ